MEKMSCTFVLWAVVAVVIGSQLYTIYNLFHPETCASRNPRRDCVFSDFVWDKTYDVHLYAIRQKGYLSLKKVEDIMSKTQSFKTFSKILLSDSLSETVSVPLFPDTRKNSTIGCLLVVSHTDRPSMPLVFTAVDLTR